MRASATLSHDCTFANIFPLPRTPFLHSLRHQNTSNSSFRDHIKWLYFGEIFQAGSTLPGHVEVSFNLHPANTSCLSVPWYGLHCWICHLPSSYFWLQKSSFISVSPVVTYAWNNLAVHVLPSNEWMRFYCHSGWIFVPLNQQKCSHKYLSGDGKKKELGN